jgi:hypothetical protein
MRRAVAPRLLAFAIVTSRQALSFCSLPIPQDNHASPAESEHLRAARRCDGNVD